MKMDGIINEIDMIVNDPKNTLEGNKPNKKRIQKQLEKFCENVFSEICRDLEKEV